MPALLVRWREYAFDKNKIVSFYSNVNYVSHLVLYEFSSTRISSLKAVRDILTFNSDIVWNDLRPLFFLDVGCGNGTYSMLVFRTLKNITFLYTDVGTPQVRITKLRIKNANNLGVVSDVKCLPFRSNVLDIVICMDVLEHLENPLNGLQELNRVVRSNGLITLNYPITAKERNHIGVLSSEDFEKELHKLFSKVTRKQVPGNAPVYVIRR